jgi:hypothetical protein
VLPSALYLVVGGRLGLLSSVLVRSRLGARCQLICSGRIFAATLPARRLSFGGDRRGQRDSGRKRP